MTYELIVRFFFGSLALFLIGSGFWLLGEIIVGHQRAKQIKKDRFKEIKLIYKGRRK